MASVLIPGVDLNDQTNLDLYFKRFKFRANHYPFDTYAIDLVYEYSLETMTARISRPEATKPATFESTLPETISDFPSCDLDEGNHGSIDFDRWLGEINPSGDALGWEGATHNRDILPQDSFLEPCSLDQNMDVQSYSTFDVSAAVAGQTHFVARSLTFTNYVMHHFWHRVDVVDEHFIRDSEGRVVKKWTEKDSKKRYKWESQEEGTIRVGEESWTTYRYQLEEFVNRIKGRQGSGLWTEGEDTVNPMKMIDTAYLKAELLVRPTSAFR